MKNKYMRNERYKLIAIEAVSILLLLLFLFPFYVVIINAAKSLTEIIQSPMSFPKNWSNIFKNFLEIIGRDNIRYFNAFFNSVIITTLSLVSIGIFSAMAAWVLVRTKTKISMAIFFLFFSRNGYSISSGYVTTV